MRRFNTVTARIQALRTLISVFMVMLAGHSTAFAYLDLGTGSFILQAVLAGLAAAWLTCSMYWQRIKGFFQKKSPDTDNAPAAEKTEQRDSS